MLGNIVIWGLIIAFILWLMQDLHARPHRHHIASGASAREILDRRPASGEINAEECQRLRTTLSHSVRSHTREEAQPELPPSTTFVAPRTRHAVCGSV